MEALAAVKARWVTQMSINAAHDEEFLATLSRSGCQGVLIGFESLDDEVLKSMRKNFNTMRGGFEVALANLRRHNIRVYGTFVFGYDGDKPGSADEAAEFSIANRFYLAAFNHLTPFPGTPLYTRLQREGRLLHERWWLDERYRLQRPALPPGAHGAGRCTSPVHRRAPALLQLEEHDASAPSIR